MRVDETISLVVRKMRTVRLRGIRMTRFLAIASIAFTLSASVTAADAGSQNRHHARMAYRHVVTAPQVGPIWSGPNQCWTDEGYGRYAPCNGLR